MKLKPKNKLIYDEALNYFEHIMCKDVLAQQEAVLYILRQLDDLGYIKDIKYYGNKDFMLSELKRKK